MTVAALVAAVASGGIVLPHLLALQRAEPATACLLWAAALGLRAPSWSEPWPGRSYCCIPGTCCAPSPSGRARPTTRSPVTPRPRSAGWRSPPRCCGPGARGAGRVRRPPARARAAGPRAGGSVIVGGDDVVLAAAGLARPTLVVSAGALARLDDAELAAAIAHERAHIRRRHRYVLLYAELCRVLGRPLPGTARAVRQLRFHIERDADRSAVRERADRLALASAICKAATGATTRAGMAALGGDGTAARVRELLQDAVPDGRARGLRALAVGVAAFAVAAALSLPPLVGGLGDPIVLCGG